MILDPYQACQRTISMHHPASHSSRNHPSLCSKQGHHGQACPGTPSMQHLHLHSANTHAQWLSMIPCPFPASPQRDSVQPPSSQPAYSL
uniref:Uncharacterized protein n=1 Tax=Arundo donax TaxID=35708 RepID=A0A0A9A2L0_ARUDO